MEQLGGPTPGRSSADQPGLRDQLRAHRPGPGARPVRRPARRPSSTGGVTATAPSTRRSVAARWPCWARTPRTVPVLSTLALEFGVCTRWFCSVPGETWPNRNFSTPPPPTARRRSTCGSTRTRPSSSCSARPAGPGTSTTTTPPRSWAFVNLWDDAARLANWYEFPAFAEHVAAGSLPTYSFIEPNHRPPLHDPDHAPVFGEPRRQQQPASRQQPGQQYRLRRLHRDREHRLPPGRAADRRRVRECCAAIRRSSRRPCC